MPQEFQVLCCYQCEKYQVQQAKKSKKWKCVVCGEKQSLKMVFYAGSSRDCRTAVQKMNMMAGEKEIKNMVLEVESVPSYENSKETVFMNPATEEIPLEMFDSTSEWDDDFTFENENRKEANEPNISEVIPNKYLEDEESGVKHCLGFIHKFLEQKSACSKTSTEETANDKTFTDKDLTAFVSLKGLEHSVEDRSVSELFMNKSNAEPCLKNDSFSRRTDASDSFSRRTDASDSVTKTNSISSLTKSTAVKNKGFQMILQTAKRMKQK